MVEKRFIRAAASTVCGEVVIINRLLRELCFRLGIWSHVKALFLRKMWEHEDGGQEVSEKVSGLLENYASRLGHKLDVSKIPPG